MRKYAREVTFSLTFEYLFSKNVNSLDLDMFDSKKLTQDDFEYIKSTYGGIIENFDQLMATVGSLSKGFKLDRIFKVDLAILMTAVYELSRSDIPVEVCINEAVELAKRFSTEKSVGFVNGILAEYVKNYKKEG